ncbi:MAG: type 1 periplasmic binding fold superfamily protein [Saprospiraceae bacterium]|nr:type 1 periplasmic binding fold superfamily protein [Saprospiraceae bacterium]
MFSIKNFLFFYIITSLFFLNVGCQPQEENEQELITDVSMSFTDSTGQQYHLSYIDADGAGGNAPQIIGDTLFSNTNYAVSIAVTNSSTNPATDITQEIKNEGTQHQFFYLMDATNGATFTYNDADAGGNPIGIEAKFSASQPSNAQLRLVLRHTPNKSASGVSTGDITNAGGETDIDITYPLVIQ